MSLRADERDVAFNLFEYLKIQDLRDLEAFSRLTEEDSRHILSEVLKFAQKEVAPLNRNSDRIGCRFENGRVITPPGYKELYESFAGQGFIGIDVPDTYGGLGLPVALALAMAESLLASCFSFMMFPGLTRGAAHLIEVFGSKELADRYCPKMYSGQWTGTMCLTEPQAGSAVGDLRTSAKKTEGGYLIRGQKIFISCGDNDFSENLIHLVLARIEGDPEGTKGISLFVVPKHRVNPDGTLGSLNDVKTVGIEEKMGIHGSPTCTLAFGDHQECLGYLVGDRCKGMNYMFQLMNEARLMTGMQGLAAGSNAYLHALAYAKERVQGGKSTIVHYPDVRRMLATMKATVEGMRGLLLKVGLFLDRANNETDAVKKDYYQGLLELLTPICKAYCSDKGFEVVTTAMQVYGGYGYIAEYPIEQMLRDVKISSIYEGTNGIQALDLLGRKMGMKNGDVFRNFYGELEKFAKDNANHPTLNAEFASFQKGLESVGQVAMKLFEIAMGGDRDYPALQAVPFLSMMGTLTLGWVLLEQALVALPKLESLWEQAGADVEEKKAALCENHSEARFYEAKVKTARFYMWNLFPALIATGKGILSEDRSALKIRFSFM